MRFNMAKYYTPKLTEAQYLHVLAAMDCYGVDCLNAFKDMGMKSLYTLHERTEEALMKAQEKK